METKKIIPGKRGFWIKMPEKEFLNQVKGILKRIPGTQRLNTIRHGIMRIYELSDLIKKNRIIVFPEYSGTGNDVAYSCAIAYEVVREWLDLYGVIHLRRTTAASIKSPEGTFLLWNPLALLRIPSTHEEYIQQVESRTRRVLRLAEKQGYILKEFMWDDHLDEIFEINTSKEIRQSEPMRGWYRYPVQPRHHSQEELKYRKYYGAFKDGKLYGYFHFYICGDIAVAKHFIGHALHLKYGIMNSLISYTVQECIKNSDIRWIINGDWQKKGSLTAFKKHAGFQGYAILVDLRGNQELLKYAKQKVRAKWRL